MSESFKPSAPPALGDRAAWLLCVLSVLAIAACIWPTLDNVRWQLAADEGRYLAFMQRVCAEGVSVLPALFDDYLADPKAGMWPDPLRIGHILTLGVFGELAGVSIETVALVSFVAHLALVVVTFVAAPRYLGNVTAVAAAALVGCSPLLLGLSRRALMDGVAVLWMSLAIWAYIAYVGEPTSRRRQAAFATAIFWAMLVKETLVLLSIPLAVHAVWWRFARRRELPAVRTVALFVGPGLAVFACYVIAAGGDVGKVIAIAKALVASPATNPYAVGYGSGPWQRYVVDFVALSPATTLVGFLGLGTALIAMARHELDPARETWIVVFVIYLAMLAFLTKNARYFAIAELPLRCFAATWIVSMVAGRGRVIALALALGGVATLCWLDVATFRDLFVTKRLYDPVTAYLLNGRGILPIVK